MAPGKIEKIEQNFLPGLEPHFTLWVGGMALGMKGAREVPLGSFAKAHTTALWKF